MSNIEIPTYDWAKLSSKEREKVLARPELPDNKDLKGSVRQIIERVKKDKDRALLEFTQRFDNIQLKQLRVWRLSPMKLRRRRRSLTLKL